MLFVAIYGVVFTVVLTILNIVPLPSPPAWSAFDLVLDKFLQLVPDALSVIRWFLGPTAWDIFKVVFSFYVSILVMFTAIFIWRLLMWAWNIIQQFFP